ncbi:GntR family transcriptional regulator [Halomonas sp. HAL1]|uniref:GntR family transcriptional regulator n=1 Tax=Halomonas sp. HAL1 TaxID=550984 RepID=UPI00022D2860|nr:GntR family transcriptional regulator [Halomonas sp. HAL1]EHA13702.1 GntR family transcriptional regulator [Halomonas sp. HAL1]WKV93644.1 GntR family transcriptional regulator [Halomonas sp. HAL1]
MDKIRQNTLHGEVAERIRVMITQGVLTPGSRVPEKQLCEQFGVSRTPLREALKVLAHEGFVELLPNRGARVAKLTKTTLKNTFEVMQSLESLSGELACARISDDELTNIEALHYQMLAYYKSGNMKEYLLANQQIHEAIVVASQNDILIDVYKNLNQRVHRVRFTAELSNDYWSKAVAEHEAMIVALRERDGANLGQVLRRHLRDKLEVSAFDEMAE